MAQITLKGNPINTSGNLPKTDNQAPDFQLTGQDLQPKKLSDFLGKRIVLNIFPSIDTGTCAASVRQFNKKAATLDNTVVLCISNDLPFAQSRFCGAEGIENVVTLSGFRNPEFATDYGVLLVDGPLAGLLARSVVVIDEKGQVLHTELVSETADEPNYEAAIQVL